MGEGRHCACVGRSPSSRRAHAGGQGLDEQAPPLSGAQLAFTLVLPLLAIAALEARSRRAFLARKRELYCRVWLSSERLCVELVAAALAAWIFLDFVAGLRSGTATHQLLHLNGLLQSSQPLVYSLWWLTL